MIVIIDYGMGNLHSVSRGIAKAGGEVSVASDPAALAGADGIILPGVGAFAKGMENLEAAGFIGPLKDRISDGIPFLGICLGMQLLFSVSEENGEHRGLNLIPGRVMRFEGAMKVPQMGWNQVAYTRPSPLFEGVPDNSYFYFVHSFYCTPDDPADTLGTSDYGVTFTSAAGRANLFGTQFHPEKSQAAGIRVLECFVKLVNR